MSKKILVSSVLVFILGLLSVSFLVLLRWQERLEEKRISTYASGELLYREGKYSEAIKRFKEVVAGYPQSEEARDARYRVALSLAKLGRYKEAEGYLEKFLEDFPESGYTDKVYYRLGRLEEEQGNLDKALLLYRKVITDFTPGSMSDEAILSEGRIRVSKGEWKSAREAFQKVIDDFPESNSFLQARKELGDLNIRLIFSSTAVEGDSLIYEVKDGDSLYSISRKFKTTIPLLMKSNRLKNSVIRPGKTLKITPGNYRLVVDKSKLILSLYLNDRLVKVYPVGIGLEDYYTPTGKFEIVNKLVNPDWYAPDGVYPYGDPKNVLGTRWMGISSPGYGIHGTTQPETVGKKSSQGCIRMLNKDVEELYDLVPVGTPVVITE